MKKSITLLLLLLPLMSFAQLTPESILKKCPPLLENKYLINSVFAKDLSDINIVKTDEYVTLLSAIIAEMEEAVSQCRQDVVVPEIKDNVNSNLQKQQMAQQMASNMAGLSASDLSKLEKIEGMSDSEAMAYLQANGLLDKLVNANKGGQNPNVNVSAAEKEMKRAEILARFGTFSNVYQIRRDSLINSFDALYKKEYLPQISSIQNQMNALDDYSKDYVEASNRLADKMSKVECSYREKILPIWRSYIEDTMSQLSAYTVEISKVDEHYAMNIALEYLQEAKEFADIFTILSNLQ